MRPHALWPLLLLGAALAGCSNTPLGRQLGESFSSAAPGAAEPAPVVAAEPKPAPELVQASQATPKPAPAPAAPTELKTPAPAAAKPALQPLPYRLVLKLPAVDPSAPAEAVTQALRAAGLPFEVETIERIKEPPANGG